MIKLSISQLSDSSEGKTLGWETDQVLAEVAEATPPGVLQASGKTLEGYQADSLWMADQIITMAVDITLILIIRH